MKNFTLAIVAVSALCHSGGIVAAQVPLTLESKIALGQVQGRIDHLAVDLGRRRLFVAELENNSVGVVDLRARKLLTRIADVKEPQGVGYFAPTDTLFVANGGDGSLRAFQGGAYRAFKRFELGTDADNVRVDVKAKQILVGYGDGALATVDAVSLNKINDVVLAAHPESFQLDLQTGRIYINIPKAKTISVVDRASGKVVANWTTGNTTHFPLTLNDASKQVLSVFRNPAKLVAYATTDGSTVASVETCGDADDLFVDAKRRRVYVSCGEGFIDVLDAGGSAYPQIVRIPTVRGARTSLFVPELDRLFVAVRAALNEPAAIWAFRPTP